MKNTAIKYDSLWTYYKFPKFSKTCKFFSRYWFKILTVLINYTFIQKKSSLRLESQSLVKVIPFCLQEQEAIAHLQHPLRTVYYSSRGLCPNSGSSSSLSSTYSNKVGSGLSITVSNTWNIFLVAIYALRMWVWF